MGSSSSPPFLPIATPAGGELGIDLPHFQPLSRFQALPELHCCHEQETVGGNIFVLWGLLMTEPEMTHIPKGPGSELPVRGAAAEVSEHSGKPRGKLSPRTTSGSHAGHVVGGCS